ncbi:ATPase family AAA domain-containing protein 3-B [Gracilariopsis chorda]|uniref:ATPase family AAA domain-containing protein 3-B n=1 Tax=Gracilariopsis chorda TaxID=448386 RepID=A0A2V3J1R1_9FLOR|nr:ATPase family AAA domain-containing protein 3-B [Gracilariopsis chorda]|eukprot:PXF48289.1 ATPase family AAA domain-containing protein 3-B [Gracilariopsis chorda]
MFKNLGGGQNSGQNKATSSESFSGSVDPTGLERAAKAAKDIDSSPNARMALELVREQERTKQSEFESKTAELRAYESQQRAKNIEIQAEQQRKTLEKQAEYARGQELYRDKLERERQKDAMGMQLQAQRQMKEEERKKDEQSVLRQEAIRRKTLEYETALRQQADIAKAKAEAEGRIEQERRNHDLIMQQKRLELRETRKTTIESIKVATSSVGAGLSSFVSDREKVATVVGGLSAAAAGIYFARAAASVVGGYVAARLGKPSLVRDTSRITALSAFREPVKSVRHLWHRFQTQDAERALDGVVLATATKSRLQRIARATKNARVHQAPFRNILLAGPPGTGKTLFAKGLARESGLEYAIFTGGDLAPLGASAVTELHKLFDWASTSRKGLLLFIDEADAFLRTRSSATGATEEMRNALNAFLYRTGQPTNKFMLMMATNRPHEFDEAAADRVDDVVPFYLPGPEERGDMLTLYVDRLLKKPAVPIRMKKSDPWESFLSEAVRQTDGFSGREMEKLVIGWQAAGYGTQSAELSMDEAKQVLRDHVEQKVMKEGWAESQREDSTRVGTEFPSQVRANGASHQGSPMYTTA